MEEEYGRGTQNAGGDDYKSQMTDSDLIKLEMLKGLISKNVNLSNFELAELTGFPTTKISKIREAAIVSESDASERPLSWDYVLCFDVGDKDPKNRVKPSKKDKQNKPEDDNDAEWEEGMDQDKYFGQIFNNFWQRLEHAKLAVEAFRSAPVAVADDADAKAQNDGEDAAAKAEDDEDRKRSKYMFLVVGITDNNLKIWADERDTDLLIDPVGGVKVGRKRNFALARRTRLMNADGTETAATNEATKPNDMKETLDISNWNYLYGEYSQQANERVYKHYKRLPGDKEHTTVFDERTRLRIIYESIIADTNEGGAEIKITECLGNKKHPLRAVFPLPNETQLDVFRKDWIRTASPAKWMWCPLAEIRDYFGEPVAFYFAFLQFYLKWLIAPALVGVIFFIWQLAAKEIAVTGIPFLCFFMIFWSVAFVDFWARAESRYRLMWGMTKFQQKAVARPQFNGEWTHDSVSGLWTEEFSLLKRACRVSAIYTFVSIWMSICVVAVVYILLIRDADPNNLQLKIMLGVANGVMIFVFDMIYKFVSVYGNEWENHRTEEDFQNAMIYKNFVFKFVNSFSSLFYLGFIRPGWNGLYYYAHFYDGVCPDAPEYMSQFLSLYDKDHSDNKWFEDYLNNLNPDSKIYRDHYDLCLSPDNAEDSKHCVQLILENDPWQIVTHGFYPESADCPTNSLDPVYDSGTGKCTGACDYDTTEIQQNEAVLSELRIQLLTLFLTAIIIQNTLEVGIPLLCQKMRANKAKSQHEDQSVAELEAEKDRYEDTIDDMSELIIQFGYVTLFVMAFPLTPLLAIVNNVIEMKVDATNLVATSQRPHPNGSFGLGSWNGILGFFSVIAVGTNVGLITWRTKLVAMILDEPAAYWIFFSILSVFLSIVVGIEKWVIPDVPIEVEKAIERQRVVEAILVLGAGVDIEADEPPVGDDDGAIQFDPSLEFIDVATLPDVPQTLAAAAATTQQSA
eukprot:62790_1